MTIEMQCKKDGGISPLCLKSLLLLVVVDESMLPALAGYVFGPRSHQCPIWAQQLNWRNKKELWKRIVCVWGGGGNSHICQLMPINVVTDRTM